MSNIIQFPSSEEERKELLRKLDLKKSQERQQSDNKADKSLVYIKAYNAIAVFMEQFYKSELQGIIMNSKIMLETQVVTEDAVRELFESLAYNILFNYSENFENGNKEVFNHFQKFVEKSDGK